MKLKKIAYFLLLCLYVFFVFSGIGFAAYNHLWVVVFGTIALGAMAFPVAHKWIKELLS